MKSSTQNLGTELKAQDIQLPPETVARLEQFCQLLWQANQRMNLTRHQDYRTFVARDLADVLHLDKQIKPGHDVLDIGSGGGVPGLVLALIRPDLNISVCDSIGKKAKVLNEFVDALQLPVTVYHDRAESVLMDMRYHVCTARAVGPMWKLLTWLKDHWLNAHRLLAFKGPRWVQEVSEAKARGLTKKLIIKPVDRYPLMSTDDKGDSIDSFIIEVRRALD